MMSNTFGEDVSQVLYKSLSSKERAIYNYILALAILTLAIKKEEASSDDFFDGAKADLISLLKTLSEIQKILLRQLNIYIQYFDESVLLDINKMIDVNTDQEYAKKSELFTSSMIRILYGPSYNEQVGLDLPETLENVAKYYRKKKFLLTKQL